jgi:inner membrane protein involved in colicin E2 resistance
MRPGHLAGIIVIYLGAALAWVILGATVYQRSDDAESRLRSQVEGLWGAPLEQRAPTLTVEETVTSKDANGNLQRKTVAHRVVPQSSDLQVSLTFEPRRKGLLWYRTYTVTFDATYTVKHDYTEEPVLAVVVNYPTTEANYDEFVLAVNGVEAGVAGATQGGLKKSVALPPGKTATVQVRYKTRGLDSWSYSFGEGVTQVKNFKLVATTNFTDYDFPPKSVSPTAKQVTGEGATLTWQYQSSMMGYKLGVEMPEKLQAGPTAARIAFFAPVGLLFFIAVIVIIGMMRGQNLHPMHYFFVAGGFFSFHLLMAYLADHLDFPLTFAICAGMSVLLVISYLIRAIGASFSLRVALPAQVLFLVIFSYTFFFKGYTGLAITVASILTLAVLMHVTAKVDWGSKFAAPPRTPPPAPPPPPPG